MQSYHTLHPASYINMLELVAVHSSPSQLTLTHNCFEQIPSPLYIKPTAAATAPPMTAQPAVKSAAVLLVLAAAPADSVALGPILIDEVPDSLPPDCAIPSAVDSFALILLASGLAVTPVPFLHELGCAVVAVTKVRSAHWTQSSVLFYPQSMKTTKSKEGTGKARLTRYRPPPPSPSVITCSVPFIPSITPALLGTTTSGRQNAPSPCC
jgi:hypothetical protein